MLTPSLKRVLRSVGALAVLCSSTAGASTLGIIRPERLTAGSSDQMLGVLGPGGRLFYVDNENGTYQIRTLDPTSGTAGLLLDDAADATWPRPSPDGKHLLYISHQTASSGQLCIRDFDEKGKPGERHCITGDNEAVFQAEWAPDGKSIAALVRTDLRGDFQLIRYDLSGGGKQPLMPAGKNVSNATFSPDGKWIAYMPIQRKSSTVSPNFAADAAKGIELRQLNGKEDQPVQILFDLPGRTGFPAFSADGKYLYFGQFLNDTNLDGEIDGRDNGVIFRVPFDGSKPNAPIDPAKRQQLTSAEWNCQYPGPTEKRLITTCLYEGSLHVYWLPLQGSIPEDWGPAKLDDESSASRSRWEKLLLLSRRFDLDPLADRANALLDVIELHLSLGELQSAEFYTHQLEVLPKTNPAVALAPALRELIAHRHAETELSRGQLSEQFIASARDRLNKMTALDAGASPAAVALNHLVESEIDDTLGESTEATRLLTSVAIADQTEPFILNMIAERAASLYRDLDTRDALLSTYQQLSTNKALSEEQRLDYADRYITWLLRGREPAAFSGLLEAAATKVPADTDLGFRIELERRLLGLDAQTQEKVRERVFDLYKANKTFDRRRALVNTTIRRSARADNDYLLYQFADTWVSYVDQKRAARRPAENLYRQVVLERAYIERARGDVGDARAHFFGVTLQTDALEAHIGFIEQRFKEGKAEKEILAEYQTRFAKKLDDPVYAFVQAWIAARPLATITTDAAQAKQAESARVFLRAAASTLWARYELQQLWGYVAHQRYLRSHDLADAAEATSHYRLALDLARETPRARAAVLEDLAQLQATASNHAIAVQYFEEREKFPWIDPVAELHHRLAKARSLLHLERPISASKEIDAALKLQESKPELAKYRPLVLDRAALYHLDAGDFAGAQALYDLLLPLNEALPPSVERSRNLFVTHLGRAAAFVGQSKATEALADLDEAQKLQAAAQGSSKTTPASYDLLLTGLRARAQAAQGNWDAAIATMTTRRDRLAARFKEDELDEDLLDLALAEVQLAEWSWQKKDAATTVSHLEAAFAHSDAWSTSTASPVHMLGLQILDTAARLKLDGGLSLASSKIDLATRLKSAQNLLSEHRNPDWLPMRDRFTAYLTRLSLETATPVGMN